MTAVLACPACGTANRVPGAAAAGTPRCGRCQACLPWIVEAGDDNFDRLVQASVPVLVDLWAPWCGPCRMVTPAVEAVAGELAGRLKVVKVNVDQAPAVSARYQVQGIPTLLLLEDGQPVDRQVGALAKTALSEWLRSRLAAPTA